MAVEYRNIYKNKAMIGCTNLWQHSSSLIRVPEHSFCIIVKSGETDSKNTPRKGRVASSQSSNIISFTTKVVLSWGGNQSSQQVLRK